MNRKRVFLAIFLGAALSAITLTAPEAQVAPGITASAIWIGRQTFCGAGCTHSSGAYTPTPGTNEIDATCIGGGGAGGGSVITGAATISGGAGGGSAGGFRVRLTSGFSGITPVIGAAGTGVSGAGGGNGTNTTLTVNGTTYTAGLGTGGTAGGAAAPPTLIATGGAGGAVTNGDIQLPGQAGAGLLYQSTGYLMSGQGGDTPFGLGQGGPPAMVTTFSAGLNGVGFGAGGSGAAQGINQGSNRAGGNGTGGICIFDEYR